MVDKANIVIASDAAIDLQTHTVLSDGQWKAEELIQHFVDAGFALAAITDHDRVDTVATLQHIAHEKNFNLLVATEMTTTWQGHMVDILCYGFDPDNEQLNALTQDILERQCDNSRKVYTYLCNQGVIPEHNESELDTILAEPAAQHVKSWLDLVAKYTQNQPDVSVGRLLGDAGFSYEMNDTKPVVDAIHGSGGVALIAHPGRGGEFLKFDKEALDTIRQDIQLDGIEAYYPRHTTEQCEFFQAYADQHDLLVSSGSDSHTLEQPPIKYRAELSRKLLKRLGIEVQPAS